MTTPSRTTSTTKAPARSADAAAAPVAEVTETGTDLVTTHGRRPSPTPSWRRSPVSPPVRSTASTTSAARRRAAFGAVRERIPGASASLAQGVSVEVGERQAAVDLDLIVEYGVPIGELSRRSVATSSPRSSG